MNQFFKEFFLDALYQIFGWDRPRQGRLRLTRHAFLKMQAYGLDTQTLADAFRYGQEIAEGRIIRTYDAYSVGLIYAFDDTQLLRDQRQETRFVIITCWKGGGYA